MDSRGLFQSTPANFTAGDAVDDRVAAPEVAVSIHARQFHSGRRDRTDWAGIVADVSIHARQFHSGRRRRPSHIFQRQAFQSTPANFTAGDAPGRTVRCALPVSIHARQFHSGRPNIGSIATHPTSSFNPRPPISQRATHRRFDGRFPDWCFNPRPPISQRATVTVFPVTAVMALVSIHARQFHSGRRNQIHCHDDPRGFNPRPPISQRATPLPPT